MVKGAKEVPATIFFMNNIVQRVKEDKIKRLENKVQEIWIYELSSGIYTLLISVEVESMVTRSLVSFEIVLL